MSNNKKVRVMYGTGPIFNKTKAIGKATRVAQVPGAFGRFPMPKKVAIRSAILEFKTFIIWLSRTLNRVSLSVATQYSLTTHY